MNPKQMIFPLTAVLIWAGNVIVSKLADGVVEPAAIAFYRWLLAGVLLLAVFAKPLWQQRREVLRYVPKLFVLSMLGMVMYQCLAYVAAQTTSATNMGILTSLMPLMAVAFSVLLLGDKATPGVVCGGLLSLLGLSYLLSQGRPSTLLVHGIAPGDCLMLLASAAYAGYGVLLKYWAIPLKTWHSLTIQICCAIPVLLVYYLSQSAPPVTVAAVPLILYAGIPASVLAPMLWMHGVGKLGPSRTTMLMNLLPVFTVLIAVLFLGEALQLYHVIGGGIALCGVLVAQKFKPTLKQPMAA